jgi:hypothetical protein
MMKTYHIMIGALISGLLLSACGGSNDKKMELMMSSSSMSMSSSSMSSSMSSSIAAKVVMKYSVKVTNLTPGQPFAPAALVLHTANYKAFDVGMAASLGLEKLAEGGDPTAFLAEASSNKATYMTTKGAGMILPGASETLMAEVSLYAADMDMVRLTLITMPANTNDAFTGINSIDISKLAVNDAITMDTVAYDAGTEKNTESAATIPGPAAGGEGFNPMRDDSPSVVSMHSGVVTKDDGLTSSALTNINRWDNPVARITITRVAP